jgi:hypothetical protein
VAAVALTATAALALLLAVLFGALVEMFRDVRQIRDALGILDRPLSVDIGEVAGTRPSVHGLPRDLDSAASALVLFLSDRCDTCRALAAGLAKPLPENVWIVLEAHSPDSAATFLGAHGLARGTTLAERVVVDVAGEIAGHVGLDTTPICFRLQDGVIDHATTVPSSRYLTSILPMPIRLGGSSTRRSSNGNA